MIRRVYQKDEMDCGVACVAMVAGVSYREARKAFKNGRPTQKIGTKTEDLYDALKILGKTSHPRLKPLGKKTVHHLPSHAILKADMGRWKSRNWHWVVYDAKRKKILDPCKGAVKVETISSYLEIIE